MQPGLQSSDGSPAAQIPVLVDGDSISQSSGPPPTPRTTTGRPQQLKFNDLGQGAGQAGLLEPDVDTNNDGDDPEYTSPQLDKFILSFDILFRSVDDDQQCVQTPSIETGQLSLDQTRWYNLWTGLDDHHFQESPLDSQDSLLEFWTVQQNAQADEVSTLLNEIFTAGSKPKLTPRSLLRLDAELEIQMRERMRRFRAEFINQYDKLQQCLRDAQPKFHHLAHELPAPRDVWGHAMMTMRRLTRLKHPSDVLDALSFLLVSRTIAESAEVNRDAYMSEFVQDLDNWAQAYPLVRNIAQLMWGSEVDCIPSPFPWRGYTSEASSWQESVLRLRESVASLIRKAVHMFDLDGDSGPTVTSPSTPSEQDIAGNDVNSYPTYCLGFPHPIHEPKKRRKSRRTPIPHDPVSTNLTCLYDLTSRDTRYSPVAATLVTGVIFALVVYFIFTFFNACTGAGNPFGLSMNPWPSMAPWLNLREHASAAASMVSTEGQGPTLWPTMLSRPSTPLAEWKPDTTTRKSTYSVGDFYLDGEISPSFPIFS